MSEEETGQEEELYFTLNDTLSTAGGVVDWKPVANQPPIVYCEHIDIYSSHCYDSLTHATAPGVAELKPSGELSQKKCCHTVAVPAHELKGIG